MDTFETVEMLLKRYRIELPNNNIRNDLRVFLMDLDGALEQRTTIIKELKQENEKFRLRLHDFCGLVKRSGAMGEWSNLAEAAIKEIEQ